jgi:hypothetical protein
LRNVAAPPADELSSPSPSELKPFGTVQDFSMNGKCMDKDEHAGRFFHEVCYCIFCVTVYCRAEDLKDEFFQGLGCTWNDLERKFNDDGLPGHVAKQKVLEMFREL